VKGSPGAEQEIHRENMKGNGAIGAKRKNLRKYLKELHQKLVLWCSDGHGQSAPMTGYKKKR